MLDEQLCITYQHSATAERMNAGLERVYWELRSNSREKVTFHL